MPVDADTGPSSMKVEPERSALLASRRWNVLVFAIAGVLLQGIGSAASWQHLTAAQALATLAAIGVVVVAAIDRSEGSLWLLVAGAWLLVASNMLPTDGARWLFINADAMFGAFALGILVGRRWVLPAAVGCGVLVHVSWAANPAGVIATGYAAWDGWIPPVQAALLCVGAHVVWQRMQRRAASLDAEHEEQGRRIAMALDRTERGRAWRIAAIRIHESLLNEMRYVLSARDIDGVRLSAALDAMTPIAGNPEAGGMLDRLEGDVRAATSLDVRLAVDGDAGMVMLDPAAYDALRAALVELARNRARHDGVQDVGFRARADAGVLSVTAPGARLGGDRAGIGLRMVVVGGLEGIGGRAVARDEGVVLEVPIMRDIPALLPATTSAFASARQLMTIALAALATSGLLYFAALVTDLGAQGALALALAAVGAAVAIALPLRATAIGTPASVALLLAPLAIPWVLTGTMATGTCVPFAQTTASALNISGFLVLCIALWSRRRWLPVPAMAAWLAGMAWYAAGVAEPCARYLLQPVLNSAVILPVIVAGIAFGTRFYARAEREREAMREQQLHANAWAAAQSDVNRHLQALVTEATSLLRAAARQGRLDDALRREIACIEARVRVAVQVDPQASGSFGTLAMALVEEAALAGRPSDVRAIEVSDDRTLLPEAVRTLLGDALAPTGSVPPTIAAFTDGTADYLTIVASHAPDSVPHPGLDGQVRIGDVEISVDPAQPELGIPEGVVFMAVRKVSREPSGA